MFKILFHKAPMLTSQALQQSSFLIARLVNWGPLLDIPSTTVTSPRLFSRPALTFQSLTPSSIKSAFSKKSAVLKSQLSVRTAVAHMKSILPSSV